MKRFILVSFLFLGFAFYEMSGGADFNVEDIRSARLEAAEAAQAKVAEAKTAKAELVVVAGAPKVIVDTDPPLDTSVTRVSLNLTSLGDVGTQTNTPSVPKNIITSSADTPAIIPSLIDPDDGASTEQTIAVNIPTSAPEDIRTVSGNSVNVRGGPGTDFGIVARLTRGDAVKVIQDDGNGWVRFETLDGEPGGWMADFLLTNS